VLPAAGRDEIRTGPAVIRSTVSGGSLQEYSVEILKIYPGTSPAGRNMLLRVTDPTLLEATGGIVQGMSGSPIIQDGKLVGAVTHVLVNDPTTGYGIFIENMLDAAA
jgi:stage IV sporulation protein B